MNYSRLINRKKCAAFFVVAIYLLISFACLAIPSRDVMATRNDPTRVINVVYDDSGSMYRDYSRGTDIDRWSQALYSMEVFAAMLGDNDSMNVYYMSDYSVDGGTLEYDSTANLATYPTPGLRLDGSSGAATNVPLVHNHETTAEGNSMNTPWAAVRKAQYDLERVQADEKWLVVLTDGAFEDGHIDSSVIQADLSSKSSDINVYYLVLTNDNNIYLPTGINGVTSAKVDANSSILERITEMIPQVFNTNTLPGINPGTTSFNLALPMSEIIVFAQGANVSVNSMSGPDGACSGNNIDVAFRSTSNSTSHPDSPTDNSLKGQIAIYKDAAGYAIGDYSLNVSGAESLMVFYKPNVELRITVGGNLLPADAVIEPGTADIQLVFVEVGTENILPADAINSLLGNIDYSFSLDSVDDLAPFPGGSGQIDFTEGNYTIYARADFLSYNYVEAELPLRVEVYVPPTDTPTPTPEGSVIPVTFEITESEDYTVSGSTVDTSDPIIVHALLDGREFTAEEWAIMEVPEIELTDNAKKYKLTNPEITKLDSIGDFEVIFEVDGSPAQTEYVEAAFTLTYSQEIDEWTTWAGDFEGEITFSDDRSWFEQNRNKVIAAAIGGAVLLLALLYMPFIKRYLPKMKSYPTVEIEDRALFKSSTAKGSVKKDILTTILPIVPQTGTINYLPSSAAVPKAVPIKVKAAGGGRMIMTNQSLFEQKDCPVSFSGRSLVKDDFDIEGGRKKSKSKPYYLSAGTIIEVDYTKKKITYICKPNR